VLTISSDQWKALAVEERRRFVRELNSYARTRHPDRFWRVPEAEGDNVINAILNMATSHGLPSRRAAVLFVDLVADYGLGFPNGSEDGWAREILARADLTSSQKTSMLAAVYDDSGDAVGNSAASGHYMITDEPLP